MSQVRYRVAALALGGLFLGGPLLTNGTASAEQIEGGGRQVVFGGGGVLGLSCRSTPSVGALNVPADSTVRVVNRTGHAARLTLAGSTKGTLPKDGSTEVVFRRGTTAVLLSPDCALGTESTPLLVTATPEPIPSPPEAPEEVPTQDTATIAPGDTETPAPSGSSTTAPGSASPTSRPTRTRTTTVTTRPGTTRTVTPRAVTPATAAGVPPMPQGGGATTKVKTKVLRGTGAAAPTFSGMPPGDQKAIVSGVPTLDLPSMSEAAVAAASGTPSDVAAAEPVAQMRPMPEQQPIGLLAVIAGVFAMGVGVAAIRSFVSQRASRANVA